MEHSWSLTPIEAGRLQKELAGRVRTDVPLPPYRRLAAADVSFNRGSPRLFAAVVVMEVGNPEPIERVGVESEAYFPYIPGYLSFREAPALLKAFERLKASFDVVLCDGQGIAHPRRLGIASHLGLWLEKPTVGCAKSRLFGRADEPGPEPGDWSPLLDKGEVIGRVLRTKRNVKPLYISPGHLCDAESAVRLVMDWVSRYRLPQPIRLAHDYVNQVRRDAGPDSGEDLLKSEE